MPTTIIKQIPSNISQHKFNKSFIEGLSHYSHSFYKLEKLRLKEMYCKSYTQSQNQKKKKRDKLES